MKHNILKSILIIIVLSISFSVFSEENFSNYSHAPQQKNAMLFVSLGMPKLVLRQYLIQSKELGIPLVIRGLLQNSYPVTAKRIYQILHPKNTEKNFQKEIKGGFEIDPVYFRKFHISVVPALVVTNGSNYSVVYGNIPIKKLLQLISKNSKYPAIKNNAKLYLEKTIA